MTLRIFEERVEVAEPAQQGDASFPARLIFCGWASLVAVVPTIISTYSALGVTNIFRGMKDAENATPTVVLSQIEAFNTPLVIGLGVAALLAFALFIVLATSSRHRLASVGLPFSIGVLLIAATPALFLWFAETTTLDVFAGRMTNAAIPVVARNISLLLFTAQALGLVAQGATLCFAIVSLLIPAQSRRNALSLNRAIVWAVSAMLLLGLAAAFVVVI